MPIYLWKCENCEDHIEVSRRLSDIDVKPNKEDCEKPCCKKPKFKRVPSLVALGFGMNWATNTWKNGGGGKGNWTYLLVFIGGRVIETIHTWV
jgi:predicted nucleic acid-binding Zn ribbon protein